MTGVAIRQAAGTAILRGKGYVLIKQFSLISDGFLFPFIHLQSVSFSYGFLFIHGQTCLHVNCRNFFFLSNLCEPN
jgi:hypothetical protein